MIYWYHQQPLVTTKGQQSGNNHQANHWRRSYRQLLRGLTRNDNHRGQRQRQNRNRTTRHGDSQTGLSINEQRMGDNAKPTRFNGSIHSPPERQLGHQGRANARWNQASHRQPPRVLLLRVLRTRSGQGRVPGTGSGPPRFLKLL